MRRSALVSLAALVVGAACAPSAFAVNSVLKFDASFSPTTVGTKKKPRAITLKLRPYYDTLAPDADAPFAWKQARLFFPKEGVFNGKYFPSCTAKQVRTASGRAKCKKAEIGKVDAKGFALGLVEPLKVKIYNLPKGRGVAMYLSGDNPVIIDHVIEGILTRIKHPIYGYRLVFDVPADLQQPAPGAYATALDFKVTIPKRYVTRTTKKRVTKRIRGKKRRVTVKVRKKYPFIATTGCPKDGIFRGAFETDNTDGTTTRVEVTAPCKKPKAKSKTKKKKKKK